MKLIHYHKQKTVRSATHLKVIYTSILLLFATYNAFSQQPYFYGLTTNGSGGYGSVFRTDTGGQHFEILDSFTAIENGKSPFPQKLIEVNSRLYGIITNGGKNYHGVLFEYNPTNNSFVVKHHFTDSTGSHPAGDLLLASNGNLYGTTINGGPADHGTIFEFNPTTGVLKKVAAFNGPSTGAGPKGKMVEKSGKIYGTCETWGANNGGMIFEFDLTSKTFTKAVSFASLTTGTQPQGGVMLAANGKLYGITTNGGANGVGTLFEYNIASNTIAIMHNFKTTDGANGSTALIQLSNGKFYGSTQYGGSSNKGVIFEYDLTLDSLTKKVELGSTSIGYYPSGEMLETSGGKYLMLMRTGGPNSFAGTIAEYNISNNSITKKVDFDRVPLGTSPEGTLVKASINGKYYGLCSFGGTSDGGVLFEYDLANNTLTKKIDLSPAAMGSKPSKNLLLATNGKLYGTCKEGGNGYGTLFEVNPSTGKITKLADFNGTNGKGPVGRLIQAANGKLYGNTQYGGATNDFGVVYEFDINTQTITKLKEYTNPVGLYPVSGFLLAANGKLYATTTSGGGLNYGTMVEYDIAGNTLTLKDNFNNNFTGYWSHCKLMQAGNGKIYGTTLQGGANNKGAVFEFDISTGKLTGLAHFNGTNGASPEGGLFEAGNGKLYGMTGSGNSTGYNNGVLYQFDNVNNSIIPKVNFDRIKHGYGGSGEFIQGKNGNLYGLSLFNQYASGGAQVLEYNIVKDSLYVRSDLRANASGNLIQVNGIYGLSTKNLKPSLKTTIHPNPAKDILNITSVEDYANLEVKIYNQEGKIIYQNTISGSTQSVNIEGIKTGIYLVKITVADKSQVQRLIVQ